MKKVIAKSFTSSQIAINDAAFSATVTAADFDFSSFSMAAIYVTTGTVASGSPTMTPKLQVRDPTTGHYFDHTTTSPTISTAGDFKFELGSIAAQTVRVVSTFGGSGSFSHCFLTLLGKSP